MISCIQNSRGLLFQKKVSLREAFVFSEQQADEACSAGLPGAETCCNRMTEATHCDRTGKTPSIAIDWISGNIPTDGVF
jgi:hypothetical protein